MEKKFIKTSDIDLASTLYTMGFPIAGIYPTGIGEKMDFYLEESNELNQAIGEYWKATLRVEPRELLINRREILIKMKAKQYEKSVEPK
jgi:hypothetical protein